MAISQITTSVKSILMFSDKIQGARRNVTCYPTVSKMIQTNRIARRFTKNETNDRDAIYGHPDVGSIVEYIKNKFYFATLINDSTIMKNTENIQFFNIDNELVYNNFYNDFGPLNIGCLYKYCCKVNKKLQNLPNKNTLLVHCTSQNEEKRANAAYLITSYAILYLKKSPEEAYRTLTMSQQLTLKPFQDASMGFSIYTIHLLDCLNAIYKAASFGFFNFEDFDLNEYDKYEQICNGDLNWLVPRKFLAFVGPSTEPGTYYHFPECYINYFLKNNVITVIRLNKKTYDASRFTDRGIMHYEMFMPDGSVPPNRILNQFLQLAEATNGAIAIHCKAGLGRTGSLIAAYLIKHYEMTAREAIAWVRICRPGSVIGHQQSWLEKIEDNLRHAGQQYRFKYYGDSNLILHHKRGIYSISDKIEKAEYDSESDDCKCNFREMHPELTQYEISPMNKVNNRKLTRILGKLRSVSDTTNTNVKSYDSGKDTMGVIQRNEKVYNFRKLTQGDKLNKIKTDRNKLMVKFCTNKK